MCTMHEIGKIFQNIFLKLSQRRHYSESDLLHILSEQMQDDPV